jgi:Protein of unknown function (DUF1703)./Predicted AAA-ATPase.
LFNGLAIAQDAACMLHQGIYPLIALTFKDVKQKSWTETYIEIKRVIANEFRRHRYVLSGEFLDKSEQAEFEQIIDYSASESAYRNSLKSLSCYLERYYGTKTIVLIDEYDSPVHAGYMHNFYDDVIDFMRSFLGSGLKDNVNLKFSVITGILRIAKESIFSGLNNINVHTFTSSRYADKFGLLENEVVALLNYYEIATDKDTVRAWYNGYLSGNETKIYNPWSVLKLAEDGDFQPYWINTSDNSLIKSLLLESNESTKQDLEILLDRKTLTKPLNENIVFSELKINENALWNFLFACGYLTFQNKRLIDKTTYVDFIIPNDEIAYFYQTTIKLWLTEQPGIKTYSNLLKSLIDGDIATFSELFTDFVLSSFSTFDVSKSENKSENFYHAFVLGMVASLSTTHVIRSNRESGLGRYDVMLMPKNTEQPAIIMEFKRVKKETLQTAAVAALKQIEDKKYEQELRSLGYTNIIKLGIVF